MQNNQETPEISLSSLQQFIVDNCAALDALAKNKRIDSVSVFFTIELDDNAILKNLFRPLLIIIQPGNGFTSAHRDAFFDGVNKLAPNQLVGHIMVCTTDDLQNFRQKGHLGDSDYHCLETNQHSLKDCCNPPTSFIRL